MKIFLFHFQIMNIEARHGAEALDQHGDQVMFTRRESFGALALLFLEDDKAQKYLDTIKNSIPMLIAALDHDEFEIREGAETLLEMYAFKEVRKEQRPVRDAVVAARAKPVSAEQRQRLDRLLERITNKEIETILEVGAEVEFPAAWNRPGHKESVGRVLREMVKSAKMSLALQHMPPEFRQTQIPTEGLSGKTFWEVIGMIRTEDGRGVDITSRGYGQLFVHPREKKERWHYAIDGGVRAALRIRPEWPQLGFITLRGQPNAQINAWQVDRVVISYGGDAIQSLELLRRFDSEDDFLRVVIPPAPKQGMKANVELSCTVAGQEITMESVKNVRNEQTFGERNLVKYVPPIKLPNGTYMVAVEYAEEIRSLDMRDIGCTAFGADGLLLIPDKMSYPPLKRPQRLEYIFKEEPAKVAVHTLSKQQVSAQKRFVIRDIPMP